MHVFLHVFEHKLFVGDQIRLPKVVRPQLHRAHHESAREGGMEGLSYRVFYECLIAHAAVLAEVFIHSLQDVHHCTGTREEREIEGCRHVKTKPHLTRQHPHVHAKQARVSRGGQQPGSLRTRCG